MPVVCGCAGELEIGRGERQTERRSISKESGIGTNNQFDRPLTLCKLDNYIQAKCRRARQE